MLPKIWKKVLLAVCIIACIFNLMIKLVNRHSLESNLKRANDGNTVLDAIKKDENSKNLNNVNNIDNNYKNEEKKQEDIEKNSDENDVEQTKEENKTYKYTDFKVTF